MVSLYDTDPSAWAMETAQLLRERRFEEIDLDVLIDEVEDLAGRHKDAIESYLFQLLFHLLKLWAAGDLDYGRARRGWEGSVRQPRREIAKKTRRHPSLASYPSEVMAEEYADARDEALKELEPEQHVLPDTCPWTIEQVLDSNFWPSRDNRSA